MQHITAMAKRRIPQTTTTAPPVVNRDDLSDRDKDLLNNPVEINNRKKLAEMKKLELQNKETEGLLRRSREVQAKATVVFQAGRAHLEAIPHRMRSEFGKDFTNEMQDFLGKQLVSMLKDMANAGK